MKNYKILRKVVDFMKKLMIIFLFIILTNCLALAAEDITSKDNISENAIPGKTTHLKAEHFKYADNKIELSKGVTIIKGENTVTASEGVYYKKEDKATLKNKVLLKYSDGEISSEEMTAWFDQDKYIFEDKVEMLYQVDNEQKFKLRSPYLEMLLEDNSFKARQGVVINCNNRILKGDRVNYNDQEQSLELIDNVYIEEENGDWIRSKRAVFYLETDEFTADGEVEVELKVSSN